ncbi:MAG: helix-turn-helix domain-containing protein, partial [Pseudomonadota bacterium]
MESLPSLVHLQARGEQCPVTMTANLIAAEMGMASEGRSATADRLVEILFHYLLKRCMENESQTTGFLRALRDPRLLRALTLMHRHFDKDWTLDALAHRSGASRATLARRFKATMGLSPMDYLNLWRLERSRTLIESSNYSLARVAEEIGYGSAQTFTRAFRRRYGFPPSELRGQAPVTSTGRRGTVS